MNTANIETRLKQAAKVARPPRSVVDDVMRQLPASLPQSSPRSRWRRPLVAAGIAAPTVIAATLVFLFFFSGTAVRLSLADVKAAVERQAWVHIRYDVGPFKETWTNLRTGEQYITRIEGSVVYLNQQTNTRLWYWKDSRVIQQDTPVIYPPGKGPRQWTPQTAWEQIVAPLEHERRWEKAKELRDTLNDVRSKLMEYADILAEVADVPSLLPQQHTAE